MNARALLGRHNLFLDKNRKSRLCWLVAIRLYPSLSVCLSLFTYFFFVYGSLCVHADYALKRDFNQINGKKQNVNYHDFHLVASLNRCVHTTSLSRLHYIDRFNEPTTTTTYHFFSSYLWYLFNLFPLTLPRFLLIQTRPVWILFFRSAWFSLIVCVWAFSPFSSNVKCLL